MTDERDNIVRPDFGDPRMVIDRSGGNMCQHHFVVLRHHARTVVCRQCREAVDPFDMLASIARKWETVTWEEKKLTELSASIEELKREESNVKGRLRNAHKSVPESKASLYFEELMRRIGEAEDHVGLMRAINWSGQFKWLTTEQQNAINWSGQFKWLTTEQQNAVDGAMIRARRRIEDWEKRQPRRKRIARVVGKAEGEGTGES